MSVTESTDEEEMYSASRRRNAGADQTLTGKVDTLTSTLQNTNRNLRAVDKMLERYRGLGEQKATVVNALKEDLLEKEEKLRRERLLCRAGSCREFVDTSPEHVHCMHRPNSVPIHRASRQPCGHCQSTLSNDDVRQRAADRDLAVRYFDDAVVGDGQLHTLHQSIRDLSSEQHRLQQELEQERNRRTRLELETKRQLTAEDGNTAGRVTDVKQLESLHNELKAEREVWKAKHDDLCKISSQLKQALLDRRMETESPRSRTQPPCYNMLVIGDNEKDLHRLGKQSQQFTGIDGYQSDGELLREGNGYRRRSISETTQGLENQLSAKELQLARTVRQLEDVQRAADVSRQQLVETIRDLEQRLDGTKKQTETMAAETQDLKKQLDGATARNQELKQNAQDALQQWKQKCKKLEKEAEKHRQSHELAETRSVELERELESMRSHGGSAVQQFEHYKRQFADLLSVRVQLEEQVRAKDVELNQLKSVKLDLDKDLRDSRHTIDRLENELHTTKERVYMLTEEKHKLEDQLGSIHSTAFTSEHQLYSAQKDLQDANVNTSQLAAQLAKLAADNQELKMKVSEQQNTILSDREEINELRQKLHQVVQQEVLHSNNQHSNRETESRSVQELIRRLKAERAELYAQLQTLKMELDEQRASGSRYKSQSELLQLELDQLTQQLYTSEGDTALAQHQYYKLRHELLNNTMKERDVIEKHVIDF